MDKTLFHDISYGMYIVSTNFNGKKVGCVVNTICQITSEDMIISVSINKNNFTNEAISNTKNFAVSIISEETNPQVIKTFGFYSSKDINKFLDFEYDIVEELPVIKEKTSGYFICEVINIVDCGTHSLFLAKVKRCQRFNNNTPMTYAFYHNVIKGKAPKTAPTYIEEKIEKSSEKKYVCLLCGFVYDDEKEKQKFETLPDTWICPICGVPKSAFKEVTD